VKSKFLVLALLLVLAMLAGILGFPPASQTQNNQTDGSLDTTELEDPKTGEANKPPAIGYEVSGPVEPNPPRLDDRRLEPKPPLASLPEEAPLLSAVKTMNSARTAGSMEEALGTLARIEPELAETRRRDLHDFCNPVRVTLSPDPVKEKIDRFCADYGGVFSLNSSEPGIDKRLKVNSELRAFQDLSERLDRESSTTKSERFTELVRGARFPDEIYALISINFQQSETIREPFWKLGEEIRRIQFPDAQLVDAQEIALLLFRCIKFGGCGNDQYFTIIYCESRLMGQCLPSASLEEVLFRTRPAVEFALAQEILARLLVGSS